MSYFKSYAIIALILTLVRTSNAQMDTSIRSTNWDRLVSKDRKHFKLCEDCSFPDGQTGYTINTTEEGGWIVGPIYADLNHDGIEDAVLEFHMDGSGIFGSYVVYLQTKHGPRFTVAGGGNHFEMWFSGDTLFTRTGSYLAMDPNCCPREEEIVRVVANGDKVTKLRRIVRPSAHTPSDAVEVFYSCIYALGTEQAYEYLSDSYRRQHPFKQWASGYAHLKYLEWNVDTALVEGRVPVTINSTDLIEGKEINHNFAGTWKVEWDEADPYHPRWVLTDPHIRELKK